HAGCARPPRTRQRDGARRHPRPPSSPTRRSSDLLVDPHLPQPVRPLRAGALERRAGIAHWRHLEPRGEPGHHPGGLLPGGQETSDRKSTRLNSSHVSISYAVFCLKKKRPATTTRSIADTDKMRLSTHPATVQANRTDTTQATDKEVYTYITVARHTDESIE